MLRCRLLGHRPEFSAQGRTMSWCCQRGCGELSGSKRYDTGTDARRYAAAFNHRDRDDLGRRAPLLGLFPLRLWRRIRAGRSGTSP